MKVTSDKEFDGLIKSSFEDFEMEPSANSWGKITEELDKKPAKKFSIFWSAAASVVIVLGIGIGLYTKPTEVIRLKASHNKTLTAISIQKYSQSETLITRDQAAKANELQTKKANRLLLASNGENNIIGQENTVAQKKSTIDATFDSKENVLDITNLDEDLARIKPIKRIQSVALQMIDDETIQTRVNMNPEARLALGQNENDKYLNDTGANSSRKPSIKSVGDLVNFMIAKVDKRDEKIIKMSKTEEGDNEITGINLGLFKFRKAYK